MSGNRYEIRTLQDIASLPTLDAMERCLKEVGEALLQARAAHDLIAAVADHLAEQDGATLVPSEHARLKAEMVTWIDDNKGEIEVRIKDHGGGDFLTITKKRDAPPEAA